MDTARMRLAWIALALTFVCTSWAQTPKVKGTAHNGPLTDSQPNNQTRERDYPTKDARFSVTVLQSSGDAERSRKLEDDAKEYNDNNLNTQRRMAAASEKQVTAGLIVAGLAGVEILVTAFGLIFLRRTYIETKATAEASINAANSAREQVVLAREEFIASHRPRLKIRNFRIAPVSKDKILIQYRVVNVGDTTATIVNWNQSTVFMPKKIFPALPVYAPSNSLIGVLPLESGMSWPGVIEMAEENIGGVEGRIRQEFLYVYGFIRYSDRLKNERELFFCRLFNPETERFEIGDEEHDYAD